MPVTFNERIGSLLIDGGVGVMKGSSDFGNDLGHQMYGNATMWLRHVDEVSEVHTVHELEHEIGEVTCLAEVVNRRDVWMIQARHRPRLASKALVKGGVIFHNRGQVVNIEDLHEGQQYSATIVTELPPTMMTESDYKLYVSQAPPRRPVRRAAARG